ncbi:hypothetical protein FACS1894130_07790 [Spirochaetia bacterium]|nr:hypothetical protein FACS1894130_07790 [Spirochaetia bacterium]
MAHHGLVDGIVDYFKHQMMEAVNAGGTDIHTGPLADGLKTFKNLNALGGISGLCPGRLLCVGR